MAITINGTSGISGVDGSAATPALQGTDSNTGISFGSDVIIGSTGGTERWRTDASGRLLVGTSSASASSFLHVQGRSGATTDYAGFHLRRGSLPSAAGQILGLINFTDNSENQGAWIYAESDAGSWTSGSNHRSRLVFSTTADGASSPTERMRITSGGEIWVGTTTVQRYNNITTAIWGYDPGAGDGAMVFVNRGTAGDGAYQGVALGKAATSWSTYSDERGKTNLAPIQNGLEKVATLRAVTGRYLEDEEIASRSFLIAQDVQAVLPEAVDGGDPDKLSLRYTEVIPLLVAALKESKERIEALEQRLADAGIA